MYNAIRTLASRLVEKSRVFLDLLSTLMILMVTIGLHLGRAFIISRPR
jgi:hypothetical protein